MSLGHGLGTTRILTRNAAHRVGRPFPFTASYTRTIALSDSLCSVLVTAGWVTAGWVTTWAPAKPKGEAR